MSIANVREGLGYGVDSTQKETVEGGGGEGQSRSWRPAHTLIPACLPAAECLERSVINA